MDHEYFAHCACLVAGDDNEWLCGSHSDDPIESFDECPEKNDRARMCHECDQVFDNDSYGHDYDCIGEYGIWTECKGVCPYCTKDMPERFSFILHGYVVQDIDTRTGKCIGQEFHIIEETTEDEEGNYVPMPEHVGFESRPIRIVQEPVDGIQHICDCGKDDVDHLEWHENAGMCWQCRDKWKKEVLNGQE
jgi:hypothetical protein